MKWDENMRRHILTIGIRTSLLNALESTVPKDKVQIITSPDIKIAEWLLAHRGFAVMLVDLELFLYTRLASNSQRSSCLCLLYAGIMGVH